MVEDSKRRNRGQKGPGSAGKGRMAQQQAAGGAVAAADQDAFAAFTSKYRDMLRFADADEAEAVYSMVSLTQAAHRQQQQQGEWLHSSTPAAHIQGPVIEVPGSRAVKRRPVAVVVPASSACSEGGRSDSSAKSAPGPPPHLHAQHWHSSMHVHHGPSMLAAALGPPGQPGMAAAAPYHQHRHQQQQQQPAQAASPASDGAAAAPGGDIHPGALGPRGGASASMNMNMPPPFFPPGMMMGGCPMNMPFMPPWGMNMNPMLMQSMMYGGLPMPPLPMPPLMPPFMPPMNMAAAAAEPAAGIPVSGPLPPAGNAFRAVGTPSGPAAAAAAAAGGTARGSSTAGKAGTPAAAAGTKSAPAAAADTPRQSPALQQQQQQQAAQTPRSLSPAVCTPAAAGGAGGGSNGVAAAAAAGDLLRELEALDVVSLRQWVVSHFCEEVYLLLLDALRPDSPKVREAVWAWRLHCSTPSARGAAPDYRAFLVSLFGLDKLTQLTAAAARQDSTALTKVASCQPVGSAAAGAAAAGSVAATDAVQAAAAAAVVATTAAEVAAAAGCVEEPQAAAAAAAVPAVASSTAAAAAPATKASGGCSTAMPAAVFGPAVCPATLPADGGMGMTPEQEAPSAADGDAACTTSNLSSEPGAALTAPGPHVMSLLAPPSSTGPHTASATSPHRAQLQLQGLQA